MGSAGKGRLHVDAHSWGAFTLTTGWLCCWWCGRGCRSAPNDWNAPWLIERAHITNKPRLKDRRCAVLLCSCCHRIQHGADIVCSDIVTQAPTLEHMLQMKRLFDRDFYDREMLQYCSIAKLPRAERIPAEIVEEFESRHGEGNHPQRAKGYLS